MKIRLFLPRPLSYEDLRKRSPKLLAFLDEIDVQCDVQEWQGFPEALPVLKEREVAFAHMPDPAIVNRKHVAHFATEKGYFLFCDDTFVNSVGDMFDTSMLLRNAEACFQRRRILINISSPDEQEPTIFSISMRDWREIKVAAQVAGRRIADFIADLIHRSAWTSSPQYTSKGRLEVDLTFKCGKCGEVKNLGPLKEDKKLNEAAFNAGCGHDSVFGWVCPDCVGVVVALASARKKT
ncbi:MAG: hypothetical protein Q7S16_03720 [bacterium]|nr:hypothetical protein [bacterium]